MINSHEKLSPVVPIEVAWPTSSFFSSLCTLPPTTSQSTTRQRKSLPHALSQIFVSCNVSLVMKLKSIELIYHHKSNSRLFERCFCCCLSIPSPTHLTSSESLQLQGRQKLISIGATGRTGDDIVTLVGNNEISLFSSPCFCCNDFLSFP